MFCICVCGGISAAILSPSVATSVDYQQNNRKRERERERAENITESPIFTFLTEVQINDLISALPNENREALDYYYCHCSI
jgi:hypothetical protein